MGDCVITKSFNERRMRENLGIFDWELTNEDHLKIGALPESRGNYDFLVSESGPYKTAKDLWDGEIVAGQCKQTTDGLTNRSTMVWLLFNIFFNWNCGDKLPSILLKNRNQNRLQEGQPRGIPKRILTYVGLSHVRSGG